MTMFLTPRDYRIGLQCRRKLWFSKHGAAGGRTRSLQYCKREYHRRVRAELYRRFSGRTHVRNPRLLFQGAVGRGDLLLPSVTGGWIYCSAYPSYKLKEKIRVSVLFSVTVFQAAGLSIDGIHLYLLNSAYRKRQDADDIFVDCVLEPPTLRQQREFKIKIKDFFSLLNESAPPHRETDCSRRHCGYRDRCAAESSEDPFSTLELSPAQKKRLLKNGIKNCAEIPLNFSLSRKQRIQADAAVKKEAHIEADKLEEFIKDIRYPLCCMDFESVTLPLPPYPGMKPWESYPYLYALDIRMNGDASIIQKDFFVDDCRDGREDFLRSLISEIPDEGTILVFDASSERKILSSLTRCYPRYSDEIDRILGRIKDLYLPFAKYLYYHPLQEGKLSLKTLFSLVAARDRSSYESLEVQSGLEASAHYLRYRNLVGRRIDPDALADFKSKLVRYCRQDSSAAAAVFDHLVRALSEIYPKYLVFSQSEE